MNKFYAVIFLLLSSSAIGHTWDEPWHKGVVSESETFGLYEVIKNSGASVKVKLIRHLAGKKTKRKIKVTGYYLFDLGSSASDIDHHPFQYKKGDKVYALLKKQGKNYAVATPTSGIDPLMGDGSISATYRHSLHRSKAQRAGYELLQTCIFHSLHNQTCSQNATSLIDKVLREPVAILSKEASPEEADRFFQQHAALETAFLTSYNLPYETIRPFLESSFFHVQISAVRALWATNFSEKSEKLIAFVKSNASSDIAKVMAIILLKERPSGYVKSELIRYLEMASEKEVTLGGSFMDPRVGTWFPESVKASIEWFLAEPERSTKSSS